MADKSYVVCGYKTWNRRIFEEQIRLLPGRWHYIGDRSELTLARLASINPRYVFFLHWSWKVPQEILSRFECVCFHMTDVPYGRGGSPLQNLILRGHRSTKLTALKMVEELDAGPVYMKRDLSLDGSAEDILVRATDLAAEMIREIIRTEPVPIPQEGEMVVFKRRTPAESRIPALPSLQALYDFIRMLDAEGYPCAFLEHEGYRYEFHRASLQGDRIEARVTISRAGENPR